LLELIDRGCDGVQERVVARAAKPSWSLPASCKEPGFDADPCRVALSGQVTKLIRTATEEELAVLRRSILGGLEARGDLDQIRDTYDSLDGAFRDVEERMEDVAERTGEVELADLSATNAAEKATQAASKAASELDRVCREEAIDKIARFRTARAAAVGAEDALVTDLTKESGFSPIVRCQWLRQSGARDALDCKPGLRVSGQDAAVILILPPSDNPELAISWAQATTAEETWQIGPLSCPQYASEDARKLTCDQVCFGMGCPDGPTKGLGSGLVEIAVHMPRMRNTSYGCRKGRDTTCALDRLRGAKVSREKLSLLLRGKTPYIAVRAMDQYGRVASGTVLVGYERWRIETGGFLAVTGAVDEELVLEEVDETTEEESDDGQTKVVKIRDADDFAQETGIFVSFIPRNYEALGVGLGIATHDGQAPSLYLGPTLRLRSFGHRGLAALSLGAVLRPVDRFPDVKVGDVLAADSAKLQPDQQFELDGFIGIQLGFSFGPISSATDD
jgi:hypothetical protein